MVVCDVNVLVKRSVLHSSNRLARASIKACEGLQSGEAPLFKRGECERASHREAWGVYVSRFYKRKRAMKLK
jgi:hypothetical protein